MARSQDKLRHLEQVKDTLTAKAQLIQSSVTEIRQILEAELAGSNSAQHSEQIGEDRLFKSSLQEYLACFSVDTARFKKLLEADLSKMKLQLRQVEARSRQM